jgi:hypothetical protein
MGDKQIPWSGGCKIKCCKDCVAPKRHLGCHDTCEDYKKEKAEHDKSKQNERKKRESERLIDEHDFDMTPYAGIRKRRRRA